MKIRNVLFGSTAFLLLMVLSVSTVFGADYLPKNKMDGGNVVISGDTTFRNLYVGGGNIAVNKKVLGDLFTAGGSTNIASPIEKDLFSAGGNITVTSPVGEDARLAGGNITVNSSIGGDLLVAGGTVNVGGGTIGGDLWVGAGLLNLSSQVNGSAKISGKEIFINSSIAGTLEVHAQKKLTFGPSAKVGGTIVYYGPNEAVVLSGAQIGSIEYHKTAEKTHSLRALFGLFFFLKLLSLLIGALLFVWLLKNTSGQTIANAITRPWMSLIVGIVGMIVIPILSVILLITLIGSFLGVLFGALFIIACILSAILMVLFIGSLSERWIFRKKTPLVTWKTALIGVIMIAILHLIPVVGWLALIIAYVMTFGSLLQLGNGRRRSL